MSFEPFDLAQDKLLGWLTVDSRRIAVSLCGSFVKPLVPFVLKNRICHGVTETYLRTAPAGTAQRFTVYF